jgi:putative chitobiose transport system substrate-binding protein
MRYLFINNFSKIFHFFLNIFILVFILFLFSSCLDNKKSYNNNKIIFWTVSLKPYFTSYIQNVIYNFESIYNIKVEWQDIPLDSVYQKLQTAYYTDFCPNVVNLNLPLAYGLFVNNYIYSFDLIKYQDFIKDYNQNLIEGCVYDKNSLFSFPWYSSVKLLIFNKSIYDFNNVKFKDIFEFLEIIKRIKEERGVFGVYPFIKFEQDMLAFGFIDNPLNPFNNNVLKFYQKLRDIKDYLPSGFWVSSVDIAYSMYKDKKVASILIGPQFVYRIKQEDIKLYQDTDVIKFPFKYYPVSLMVLSVIYKKDFNNQKYIDSFKFIKFITNKENQSNFARLVPVLPSVKVNLDDIIYNNDDSLTKKIKKEMLEIFDKSKVFDLYFVNVIDDPIKRTNILKEFNNEIFNTNNDIKIIFDKYQKIWVFEFKNRKIKK